MKEDKLAQQLFDRWKTNLTSRDPKERETDKAQANFEELFYELSINKIQYETVEPMLDRIAAAHMPTPVVAEKVWTAVKKFYPGISKKDWLDSWYTKIVEAARVAFYTWYKIPGEEEESQLDTGTITPQEFAAQQKYANTFKTLTKKDLQELDDKRQKFMKEELDFNF
jgi:hypothetical protein